MIWLVLVVVIWLVGIGLTWPLIEEHGREEGASQGAMVLAGVFWPATLLLAVGFWIHYKIRGAE